MVHRPSRAVAVCLVGLSPAIVTETLYALAVSARPRVVPHEVYLLTTLAGLEAATRSLLGRDGALARLRHDYRLPPDAFRCPPENVRVLADARGNALRDIVTTADSEAVGNQIAELVRDLAGREPPVELHCSLSGGRKSMGALLTAALQLHGRAGDRLYHVLVSPPYETADDFFYPTPTRRLVRAGGARLDARRARVSLAEIPIVKLGPVVRDLGLGALDMARLAAEVEAEARGRLVIDPLVVDLRTCEVRVGADRVRLTPRQMVLYAAYAGARRACRERKCRDGGRCGACHPTDDELHEGRTAIFQRYPGPRRRPDPGARFAAESPEALEAFREWIEQTRSRLNDALRRAVGSGPRGRLYLVSAMSRTGDGARRRGLGAPPSRIHLVEAQA